jgi:hypothetical protein
VIKRRETRIEYLADEIRRWPGHWRVALLFLVAGALFAAAGLAMRWELSTPMVEVEPGTVVRFSGEPYGLGTRGLVIVIRLKGGRLAQLQSGTTNVRHCRVGSTIRLNRKGSYLRIHPAGCPAPS